MNICENCKYSKRSSVWGRASIYYTVNGCKHPDNIKKIKTNYVTGKKTISLKKEGLYINKKWNGSGNCERYKKQNPSHPPILSPPKNSGTGEI